MFNLFKKSEFEIISQKIKYKNHKITEALNKTEFQKLSKLSQTSQKKKIKELVESMSGLDFSYVFSYQFHFEDLPMFSYQLHIKENNYQLLVYGKDEFNGFQCDFLLNENVFRLTMKTNDEFNEDEEDFKRLVGKEAFEISKKTRVKPLEVTKKTKKLHSAMISTNYLNEFSYNEQKKNPIRVI